MKTLILSATALSLTGAASANDWSAIDLDLEAMASGLQEGGGGATISGVVDAYINQSGDAIQLPGGPGVGGAPDVLGFSTPNVRLRANGSNAGYGFNIEYDVRNSAVLDANVTFPIGDITGTMGWFRAPLASSGLRNVDDQFFVNRSIIGNATSARQAGAMLNGAFEDQLDWWLAVQNGTDGLTDEHQISARASFNFMGNGLGATEGAYGGSEDMNGTVSVSFGDDGGFADGGYFGIDAGVATGDYWASIEFADFDAGYTGTGSELPGQNIITGDQTPMVLAGGWMLTPNEWEIGARFTDHDDAGDTTTIDIGVNHYNSGHDVKWTIQLTSGDSDNAAFDGTAITAGVQVSF